METLYQKMNWGDFFEVKKTEKDDFCIFKNSVFIKAFSDLDLAKDYIKEKSRSIKNQGDKNSVKFFKSKI